MKSQIKSVVRTIMCLLLATTGFSQVDNQIDTLTYFANQNVVVDGLGFIADVDGFGIYFTPDTTWSKYDLLELHLLLSPYIYQNGDSSFSGKLYVHLDNLSNRPSAELQSISFSAQGAKDIYPNWKTINLRDSSATKLLENNFWLLGLDLAATVVSETNSGHTFFHSFILQRWDSMTYDYAVKAIVQQNTPTSVGQQSIEISNINTNLIQNYPNPFNQETNIKVFLNEPIPVTIDIFDVSGRLVRTLILNPILQGQQTVLWDGKDFRGRDSSSGVYFYRLRLGHDNIVTRKMILIR